MVCFTHYMYFPCQSPLLGIQKHAIQNDPGHWASSSLGIELWAVWRYWQCYRTLPTTHIAQFLQEQAKGWKSIFRENQNFWRCSLPCIVFHLYDNVLIISNIHRKNKTNNALSPWPIYVVVTTYVYACTTSKSKTSRKKVEKSSALCLSVTD